MDGMVVEVRYQGIVVQRGARVRDLSPQGAFVEFDGPLPVGTVVALAPDGGPELRARVAHVVEVGAERGMALAWSGLAADARRFLSDGLGQAVSDAGAGAPAAAPPAASAAVRAVPEDANNDATEPMTARTTLTDLAPPVAAVPDEVNATEEVSAPVDVPGGDGAPRPDGADGNGGKGKRGKRRRR